MNPYGYMLDIYSLNRNVFLTNEKRAWKREKTALRPVFL